MPGKKIYRSPPALKTKSRNPVTLSRVEDLPIETQEWLKNLKPPKVTSADQRTTGAQINRRRNKKV